MTVFSDYDIREALDTGMIEIEPFPADMCIQPASVDLHLGNTFLDVYGKPTCEDGILMPNQFVLCSTEERVSINPSIAAKLEGKSSLARQGIIVQTAGFVDPGWNGQLTLEVKNLSERPFQLVPGHKFVQIRFENLISPASRPYGTPSLGSHYQNSEGTVIARS